MRGNEAKRVCPDIHLIRVPTARGKADLNVYRNAGSEVWLAQSTDTPNISCLETLVCLVDNTKGIYVGSLQIPEVCALTTISGSFHSSD